MEAARAIAATFCYTVRYALTPVFGHKFPEMCLKPGDEHFGTMTINPIITERCRKQTEYFREQELESRTRNTANLTFAHPNSQLGRSPTPFSPAQPKTKSGRIRRHKEEVSTYTSPYSSPYMTSAKSYDGCSSAVSTPRPAYRSIFTPINTPRYPPRSVPFPERRLPSPSEILAQSTPPQYTLQGPLTPAPTVGRYSSPEISPKTIPRKIIFNCSDGNSSHVQRNSFEHARFKVDMDLLEANLHEQEQRAVYALLSLKYHQDGRQLAHALGKPLYWDGSKRWTLPEGHFEKV